MIIKISEHGHRNRKCHNNCYCEWFHQCILQSIDLPDEELRPVLVGIKDDLTKHKEDRLVDALQTESDEDAGAMAGRILDLYLRMNDLLH